MATHSSRLQPSINCMPQLQVQLFWFPCSQPKSLLLSDEFNVINRTWASHHGQKTSLTKRPRWLSTINNIKKRKNLTPLFSAKWCLTTFTMPIAGEITEFVVIGSNKKQYEGYCFKSLWPFWLLPFPDFIDRDFFRFYFLMHSIHVTILCSFCKLCHMFRDLI